MTRHEVRLAGFGGQGIILAGHLLGKAAALYDGKEAIFTQVYGPEARGGACNADVVIDDEPIDFPEVQHPEVLAVMSQEAADSFLPTLEDGGLLLYDTDLVRVSWGGRALGLPATSMATALGRRIVANMVMLGFMAATSRLVSPDALEAAIRSSVRPQTIDLNLRALAAGYAQARSQS